MPWTNQQKSTAVTACRAAGIADEYRKLILRQFPNALYDRDGNETDEPSSTSKRLNNSDFEQFMAVVERSAGGKVDKYSAGYWQGKAEDRLQRMRHHTRGIADALEARGLFKPGNGLANWISRRVTHGEADRIDQLDYWQLHALINGLRAFGRRHGVKFAA